jgi:hypothetical protein
MTNADLKLQPSGGRGRNWTGDLTIKTYLGDQVRNMADVGKDEIHHRHLSPAVRRDPPEQWQHDETDPMVVPLPSISSSSGRNCRTRSRR